LAVETKEGLTLEDVKGWSLVKVRDELKTRYDRLDEIKTLNQGKITEAEGDDGIEAAKLFRELNVIGEKHDELAPIEDGESKLKGLGEWLATPAGEIPMPVGTEKKETWKDATDLILESAGFKRYQDEGNKNFSVEMPWDALYGEKVLGENDGLAGVDDEFAPQAIRLPGVAVPVLFQPQNMAPTFLQGTTSSNAVPYMAETVTTEGAVEVLEGGAKAAAAILFAEASTPVENIAVTLQVTNILLEDEGFMRAYVTGRLRLFVGNREDAELISGDGIAPNLEGILVVSGVNTETYSIAANVTDNTLAVDTIYDGMTQIREAFLSASSIGMAAATWSIFQLAKDGNSQYLFGGPGATAPARIWGVPVVQNENFPAHANPLEAIAIWAREAAMVVRRNSISLAVSDSHASTFSSNVLTFRAEQRVAFPIFRPAGITVVTVTT
jgi:HK97 family phage major capsid protein